MAVEPVKQIAWLRPAYTPGLGAWQRHFISHPVKWGPQACLIETKNDKGEVEIVDALTIIPYGVGYELEHLEDPLYVCWLNVIKKFYNADVAKVMKRWACDPLAKTNETQPPFRPVRHGQLVDFAELLLTEWSAAQRSQPGEITSQTWLGFKDSLKRAKCWYTQHLKMREASLSCVDQWRILSLWESWEQPVKTKMTWSDRSDDYLTKYPERPKQAVLRGRTMKASNKVAAFKKRCAHIGLIQGEVPRKRLTRENLRRFVS